MTASPKLSSSNGELKSDRGAPAATKIIKQSPITAGIDSHSWVQKAQDKTAGGLPLTKLPASLKLNARKPVRGKREGEKSRLPP